MLYEHLSDKERFYVEQKTMQIASKIEELSKEQEVLEKKVENTLEAQKEIKNKFNEIKKELESIISSVGASSMADIGKVMGLAMSTLKGKADGSLISKLVNMLNSYILLIYNYIQFKNTNLLER